MRTKSISSLGGNLGDPKKSMGEALRMLDADPKTRVVAVSSLYRTPPWGKTDQPDFLNAAAEISTERSPRELLDLCLEAEKKLKRVRRGALGAAPDRHRHTGLRRRSRPRGRAGHSRIHACWSGPSCWCLWPRSRRIFLVHGEMICRTGLPSRIPQGSRNCLPGSDWWKACDA